MKLSASQLAALKRMAELNRLCNYYDFRGIGVNGKTLDWLTTRGLARSTAQSPKDWSITDDGRKALDSGKF